MRELINELKILQSKTIGLFKNKYNKHFELVIEDHKNDTFVTISIGELGGLTTSYTSGSEGEMKLFPNDQIITINDE